MYDDIKSMIKKAHDHEHDQPNFDSQWLCKLPNAQKFTKHEKFIYSLKAICDQNFKL